MEKAKSNFAQRILAHASPGKTADDFWQIPRLQELLCLLEWDNKPAGDRTRYLSPNQGDDKRILRDRNVLPAPSQVAGGASNRAKKSGHPSHFVPYSPGMRPNIVGQPPRKPNDTHRLKALLELPRVEGVVTESRGSDFLILVDDVTVSLRHKALKKKNIAKNLLGKDTRVAIRILEEKNGDFHLAELLEVL